MYGSIFLATWLLAGSVAAKQCVNITVPVSIFARQGVFDIPIFQGNLDATTFAQNFTNIRGNFTEESLTGYATVTGDYHISAKFCKPDVAKGVNPTVQFLTHGIGFDKTYWDISYNDFNYSYIDVAVDTYGFCTLSIDRLGIGNSSTADPLNVLQAPAEVSAIYELTMMLRNGTLPGVPQVFEKVVHVGHSFGSALTYSLVAQHPEASDGIILTGFSSNGSFFPRTVADWNSKLARLNQPLRFGNVSYTAVQQALSMISNLNLNATCLDQYLSTYGLTVAEVLSVVRTTDLSDFIAGIDPTDLPHMADLPSGYLTWVDAPANQYSFFYPGFFDIGILFFAESTKFPYTVGELLTIGSLPGTTSFKGPVQVVTGNQDQIFCGGDCMMTGDPAIASIPTDVKMAFPAAKVFEAYIQPNTGHAINAHYNATGAYNGMQRFLTTQGLAPS